MVRFLPPFGRKQSHAIYGTSRASSIFSPFKWYHLFSPYLFHKDLVYHKAVHLFVSYLTMSGNTMGTCPLGGLWYTCTAQTPTFMGCCTSNPCQGNGKTCPSSDLRAAGMGTGSGPDLPSNDASYWPNVQCSVGLWWTCAMQTPSFQGCCEVNPCGGDGSAGGCPSSSLHAAAFKSVTSDPVVTSTSSPKATASESTKSTSSSVDAATSSTFSTSSSSATTKTSQTGIPAADSATSSTTSVPVGGTVSDESGSGPPIAAIAGGAVGVVVILVIGILIFCFCRKRRQKRSSPYNDVQQTMIANGGDPSLFVAKGNEFHQKQANAAEGYYANQPILGSQNPVKYTSLRTISPPLSPGPPPYQPGSAQVSPNPNLHEMEHPPSHMYTGLAPINALGFHHDQAIHPVSHSRNVSGVVEDRDGIAELPHSPATENRWRAKRPDTMASVEIGESSPRVGDMSPVSDGGLGVVDNRKKARESYVSWQSLSP
ncbi:hypothetical protein VTL71DRAFT_6167 [Oculimacula yallundae]|uniref:Uncharacterized protein n=1 Tax=Oculimacula yallundae TaxID=86028 RepID=A0ABR4BZP2_9HELO